jgi:hypothetical protein
MLDINNRFHPSFHYIENNNFQSVIEAIASEQMIPVKGRTTGKQNKENSVFLVRSLLEHGLLDLPHSGTRTRELIDAMVLEMTSFGYKNQKLMGLSAHDDTVSAISMLAEAFAEFKKVGFSCDLGSSNLPLDISGEFEIDLELAWVSDNLVNLGLQ